MVEVARCEQRSELLLGGFNQWERRWKLGVDGNVVRRLGEKIETETGSAVESIRLIDFCGYFSLSI